MIKIARPKYSSSILDTESGSIPRVTLHKQGPILGFPAGSKA